MITFEVLSSEKELKKMPLSYPHLLEYEVGFKIVINNQLFFEEPNFPVLEFLYFANAWREKECEFFEYNSMETEDNPLISFVYHDCGWSVHSPWQRFECEVQFTKEELLRALDILQNEVIWH